MKVHWKFLGGFVNALIFCFIFLISISSTHSEAPLKIKRISVIEESTRDVPSLAIYDPSNSQNAFITIKPVGPIFFSSVPVFGSRIERLSIRILSEFSKTHFFHELLRLSILSSRAHPPTTLFVC